MHHKRNFLSTSAALAISTLVACGGGRWNGPSRNSSDNQRAAGVNVSAVSGNTATFYGRSLWHFASSLPVAKERDRRPRRHGCELHDSGRVRF